MAQELLAQGISAFQAGDRDGARNIFQQVTEMDPENDTAWYYLAACENDVSLRRTYLERVLEINPYNARARDVLDRLNAAPSTPPPATSDSSAPPASSSAGSSSAPRGNPIRPLSSSGADPSRPGEATTGGFAIPVTIPDAPPRVGLMESLRDGWQMFLRGVDILQRRPGVYEDQISKATWWRFWFYAAWAFVIGSLFNFIGVLRWNFIGAVLGLIIAPIVSLAVIYIAGYISHWWVTNQMKKSATLLQHVTTILLPYVPAYVAGVALTGVLSLIGLGIFGSLASLVLNVYALYVMSLGFESLYRFEDPNQKWITLAVYIVGSIIAGIIVGTIVGVLGVSTGLPFMFLR